MTLVDPRTVPVRFSNLKKMALSPAHYLSAVQEERADTATFRKGRLVHALVLGGIEDFAVYDGKRQGKAWFEFADDHADKDIVTMAEYERAVRCAASVMSNRDAMDMLAGDHEVPVTWRNLGRECSSRIDNIGKTWVAELKTSRLSAPWFFSRSALRMHYHAQLAWYEDAACYMGRKVDTSCVVAVEPTPPYAVTTFQLTARASEEGRKICRAWLERLLACEQADEWPAYSQSTIDLDVPEMDEDFSLMIDGEEVIA